MILDNFLGLRCLTFSFAGFEARQDYFVLGIDEQLFGFHKIEERCEWGEVRWRYESGNHGTVAYQRPTYSDWLKAAGLGHGHQCMHSRLGAIDLLDRKFASTFRHMVTFYMHADDHGRRLLYGVSEELGASADRTVIEIGTVLDGKHDRFVFQLDHAGLGRSGSNPPYAPRS